MSTVKCKLCGKTLVDKASLVRHIDKVHGDQIPEDWTAARYENYLRTGKTHGSCVICKEDTEWNEATGKYCRFCGKQACKDKARKLAEENLLKKKGVTHSQMLNDPEFQRKMVYAKKTSGIYKFSTGSGNTEIHYDSSYGKDFLEMLDYFMGFHEDDIMGPSPNTYVYKYEGKNHFYIPDFYIPSLNLEIEIKDGGDNPNKHPKIQAVDKVKESLKDEVMKKSKVNYVKVSNKQYTAFYKMLFELKELDMKKTKESEYIYIVESTENYIDSEISILSWFFQQKNAMSSETDKVNLLGQLNHMEDFIKHSLNTQQDPVKRKQLMTLLEEIPWCRKKLGDTEKMD